MSDKSAKRRAPKAAQEGVLGTLPSTRPARIGRARSGAAKSSHTTGAEAAEAKSSRTTAAGTKPARRRTDAAKSSAATAKRSTTKRRAEAPKPASAAPKTPPPEREGRRGRPPSGAELATTVVKAAGEVAAIGVGVGARALKRAARRVPRP
jgi:hypothetical protein